ncbi:MAG: DUF4252 domain-containing protein [Candidatus Krumholzibacteria bacterium]|nr:DUF4252 domain-containing protein [Candidatus Krumholzibacteria bacterium]
MNTPRTIVLATLMLCLLCAGGAMAENFADELGYMDLEWIVIPDDASEIQDIDLGPILGGISADAEQKGDDALVQILAMIRSIRVKSYSIEDGGNEMAKKSVDKVTAKLKTDDWKRLIYMKDGDETMSVNTKYDGPDLVGLMIVNYEPDDSVAFVNVVGDLNLGTLIGLAKRLDHDSIEDMLEDLEGIEGIEIDHDDDDHDEDDDI